MQVLLRVDYEGHLYVRFYARRRGCIALGLGLVGWVRDFVDVNGLIQERDVFVEGLA